MKMHGAANIKPALFHLSLVTDDPISDYSRSLSFSLFSLSLSLLF
jgi:hypothetical protein